MWCGSVTTSWSLQRRTALFGSGTSPIRKTVHREHHRSTAIVTNGGDGDFHELLTLIQGIIMFKVKHNASICENGFDHKGIYGD